MRKNKTLYYPKFIFLIAVIALLFMGFMEGDKKGNRSNKQYTLNKTTTSGKQGDAYRFNINNLNIPINRVGTIADVNIPPDGTLGRFGNSSVIFSSGFFLSGLTNGNLWAFAQASASLVENMTPGTVESGPNDPDAVLYVVNREDEPFGQSWIDWKTAVDKFEADFYDGDGDGQYNPVDLNGNGNWEPDEDMPDLLGDETAWCVYTDGQPGAQRTRFSGVNPQGVEIRQTIFGFASKGALGNMIFIRYRIRNAGLVASVLDSVYFGAWADPDLGAQHEDDLVGVDVPRNAGFTYNGDESDPGGYETQIPCYMIDFFSGPKSYIPGETYVDTDGDGQYTDGVDTPLDTAFSFRGQNLGISEFPGAKNLDVSSFVHYVQSDPLRGDPNDEFEARHYMLGKLRLGEDFDPCVDAWGEVFGIPCDDPSIDPRLWYSGDPVTNIGWLSTVPTDQRQMTNVGPFQLVEGEEDLEIVVAYVVGQGSDRLNSITVAREIDDGAQFIFDGNFRAPTPPPTLQVEVESGPDFIDFVIPVYNQVSFIDQTDAWDNRFHGINVTAFRTNSTQEIVSGIQNVRLHTDYQADNFIQKVFKENPETGGRELLFDEATNKLDVQVYSDPERGKIRVRLTQDPFTNGNLVKGVPYYFAFTSYALNYDALLPMDENAVFGDEGDYFLAAAGFVAEVENIPKIITTVLGENLYNPPVAVGPSNKLIGGASEGELIFDPITKAELTGDQYEVTFKVDSSTELYSTFWKLENITTNTVLLDSAKDYTFGSDLIDQVETEGFIVRISDEVATGDTDLTYEFGEMWVDSINSVHHYLSDDITTSSKLQNIGGDLSTTTGNYVTADRLRRVEIRFGETQKAYRYLNGFFGPNNSAQKRFFKYAEAITPEDTIGKGTVGMWDEGIDRPMGFVDVPFQVWIDDPNWDEMRQLTVGFIEKRADLGGIPDGQWDPGTLLLASGEYIFIFDETYDPDGNQRLYKGGPYIDPNAGYADLNGAAAGNGLFYTIPDEADLSPDERAIVESPFFNTLYAVGLPKASEESTYLAGDKIIIGVDTYPYTSDDVYQFRTTVGGVLTETEERDLFNKVTVYPNPLYGFNIATSYTNSASDEPWVTFSNLPEEITVKVYTLSGQLLRTLTQADKSSPTSPFLRWDLQNESGLRVASGLYLAIVSSPKFGEKVLKFSIIMPEKQIQKF
jgi:hypothetical protein